MILVFIYHNLKTDATCTAHILSNVKHIKTDPVLNLNTTQKANIFPELV